MLSQNDHDYYHESWLKRNSSFIILYFVAAGIIIFGIFPWIVGAASILRWIF
jgi:hypothetical protein